MKEVAVLHDKESGDGIEIFSNRNGLVIYTMDIIEDNIYFARDRGTIAKGREAIAIGSSNTPRCR